MKRQILVSALVAKGMACRGYPDIAQACYFVKNLLEMKFLQKEDIMITINLEGQSPKKEKANEKSKYVKSAKKKRKEGSPIKNNKQKFKRAKSKAN